MIAKAVSPVHRHLRPRAKEAGRASSSTRQLTRRSRAPSEGQEWKSGTRDTRPSLAAGVWSRLLGRLPEALSRSSAPRPLHCPQPCVPCGRRLSTQLKASPVEKDGDDAHFESLRRSLTSWLDRRTRWSRWSTSCTARIDSPRRVLCPWRVHTPSALCQHLAGRCSSDGRPLREM